jgi:hypothetical protein
MIRLAVTLLLIAAPCVPGGGAYADEDDPPVVVLTDTIDYCDQLQKRIEDHKVVPPEARRLFIEGRQMCDHGEVRAGINRLRRALRILNHHTATP